MKELSVKKVFLYGYSLPTTFVQCTTEHCPLSNEYDVIFIDFLTWFELEHGSTLNNAYKMLTKICSIKCQLKMTKTTRLRPKKVLFIEES